MKGGSPPRLGQHPNTIGRLLDVRVRYVNVAVSSSPGSAPGLFPLGPRSAPGSWFQSPNGHRAKVRRAANAVGRAPSAGRWPFIGRRSPGSEAGSALAERGKTSSATPAVRPSGPEQHRPAVRILGLRRRLPLSPTNRALPAKSPSPFSLGPRPLAVAGPACYSPAPAIWSPAPASLCLAAGPWSLACRPPAPRR